MIQILDTFHLSTPNYLMKVDDDTFVNLPLLYHQIIEIEKTEDVKNLLMGYRFGNESFLEKRHKVKNIKLLKLKTFVYYNI